MGARRFCAISLSGGLSTGLDLNRSTGKIYCDGNKSGNIRLKVTGGLLFHSWSGFSETLELTSIFHHVGSNILRVFLIQIEYFGVTS